MSIAAAAPFNLNFITKYKAFCLKMEKFIAANAPEPQAG